MTLTIDDLKKIRGVVKDEVQSEVGGKIRDLDVGLSSFRHEVSGEFRKVNTRLKNLEIGQNKIQKDIKYTVDSLDKQDIKTEKRIVRIEKKLSLQPSI